MRCADCPFDTDEACGREGCRARLAEHRVATMVGMSRRAMLNAAREALGLGHLEPGDDVLAPPAFDGVEAQVGRLDLEDGAIVVLRTRGKLQAATAAKYQDELERLCRAQGYREVGVIVLDDCSDLTVEPRQRPDTRMAHQLARPAPIVSR